MPLFIFSYVSTAENPLQSSLLVPVLGDDQPD